MNKKLLIVYQHKLMIILFVHKLLKVFFSVPESSPLTAQDEPYTTPRRKHQNVPTVLSSCLKNSQSVKPRRKPLKVRISNHIDWNERPPVENS